MSMSGYDGHVLTTEAAAVFAAWCSEVVLPVDQRWEHLC